MNDFTRVVIKYLDSTEGVRDLVTSIAHDEGRYRKAYITTEIRDFVIATLEPMTWPEGYENPVDMVGEMVYVLIENNYINWTQVAEHFISAAVNIFTIDSYRPADYSADHV